MRGRYRERRDGSSERTYQAVKRNRERFPEDFMFQLSWEEARGLSRSQFVTLKRGQNPKYRPYVFTEQGIAMLSSVLRSKRAIAVNIARTWIESKIRIVKPRMEIEIGALIGSPPGAPFGYPGPVPKTDGE